MATQTMMESNGFGSKFDAKEFIERNKSLEPSGGIGLRPFTSPDGV